MGVLKMSIKCKTSLAYFCFLRIINAILYFLPQSAHTFVIACARAVLTVFPLIGVGFLSMVVRLFNDYKEKCRIVSKQEIDEGLRNEEMKRLEKKIEDEKREISQLKASTNVANTCVKMLEKSLLNEVSRRRDIMLRSEIDESTQNKKVVTLIKRLDAIKNDFKQSLKDMNGALSKIEAGDNGPLEDLNAKDLNAEDLNAKDLNAKLPNEEN